MKDELEPEVVKKMREILATNGLRLVSYAVKHEPGCPAINGGRCTCNREVTTICEKVDKWPSANRNRR